MEFLNRVPTPLTTNQWVKGNAAFVRAGMYMYNDNQMRNKC